jgi:branched-chain amino acid transport system substrate-binding protein
MSRPFSTISRRRFLQSTALGAAATAGMFSAPAVLRAQGTAVKVGVLHPVSGALSYSGQQGRMGAQMAIAEINAAGGIKALGGAKIDAMLGDAQSTPEGGNAEVEKMNGAGVCAVVGGYASAICLTASQTAARYDLPYVVDVGVVDSIVTRGLKNTFRFGPGFGVIAKAALENLVTLNDQAGKAAKTVVIVHEDSAFGAGLAKLLNAQLPARGFQVVETMSHPTPTRDFNNIVLKIKAHNPDLVIPANYYNEYVLLARTMQQQRVRPKGIYSVLGGAASSYKFVKEFPEAAQYIMDCNHWFDPKNPKALALKKQVEAKGAFFTYEVYMNYSCVLLLADAIERAKSTDRAKIIEALASSTFAGHVMPYGPT